jgi:hypothetical protein
MPLVGVFLCHLTGEGIIGDHMVRTVVFLEMISQGGLGMIPGYVEIGRITGFPCGPKYKFKVHHIVDDHGVIPFIRIMIP